MPGQSPFTSPSLKAARRKIQTGGKFFQRDAGGTHHFFDHCLRKTLSNGFLKIRLGLQGMTQDRLAAQLLNYGMELVDHSVVHYSAKWPSRD